MTSEFMKLGSSNVLTGQDKAYRREKDGGIITY